MESLFYDTPEGIVADKNPDFLRSYPVIVMEMLSGGHLLNRIEASIQKSKIPSETDLAIMFGGVVRSLQSLHNRNFIHRDLKLENLILTSNRELSHVKIIDFGSMIQLPKDRTKVIEVGLIGTHGYLAPETLAIERYHEYSYKTDVWQIGCVLFT